MNNLSAQRQAIRHLLREQDPADAMAAYYALHHPDNKTTLATWPEYAAEKPDKRAEGYVALSRTGIDLFRPLVTMRLPTDRDPSATQAAADLLHLAFADGQAAIMNVPARYQPIIDALFDIQSEQYLKLYVLDARNFKPVINVLVVRSETPSGLPRFTIRSSRDGRDETMAAAALNWRSPRFGEIGVNTLSQYRRQGWGRSVVSALSNDLIESGRTPLYVVAEENEASIHLAESIGFVDTGERDLLIQATPKPLHP